MTSSVPTKKPFVIKCYVSKYTYSTCISLQRRLIDDPVVTKCLLKIQNTGRYVLSASALSRIASKYFKTEQRSTDVNIIEHFPALTLQTKTLGPNGTQNYEVGSLVIMTAFAYSHMTQVFKHLQ